MQTPSSPVKLGVAACHERGHLLVAHLDEFRALAIARAGERAHQPVDPVAWISVDPIYAPDREAI
jgi:hypothetical protein